MLTLNKPVLITRPRRVQVPRSDMNQAVELTGKFLGSFVLFTASMNWWYYRRLRKDLEKKDKN